MQLLSTHTQRLWCRCQHCDHAQHDETQLKYCMALMLIPPYCFILLGSVTSHFGCVQVNGGHLPEHIGPFCAAAAAIAAALPVFQLLLRRSGSSARPAGAAGAQSQLLLQQRAGLGSRSQVRGGSVVQQAAATLYSTWRHRTAVDWVLALLPSGVGFAVGMYLAPSWTLPRLIGSVVEQTWLLFNPVSHAAYMMVAASGLVLGEGCASVVTAVVKAAVK